MTSAAVCASGVAQGEGENNLAEPDRRPSPDALLKAAAQSGRGRLKIFLGAAPGVGKTYEMLSVAQARKREGLDVVIGIVETHGRAETLALVEGLPSIPRREVLYKGHIIEEMDLDALLARKPAIALVDELAHTNAPGSRHPKRYLDVEELLAAGIDVYTTVNIQHIESLNDVVAQITRIRVRETVPDSIIDRADDIEIIDITPDDLLQRLRDGKVYVSKTATRAINHYFSPGNLTALRELALRRTAQRVDAQLLDHMQSHAIAGPWAAGERVLVCVTRRGAGPALVRYARRLAERLRAPWTALHIETAADLRLTETDRDRIAECLRLAEKLGAEVATIPGTHVVPTIVAYAREQNVTQIVVGSPGKRRFWSRRSVAQELIQLAGDIPIHVIGRGAAADTDEETPRRPHETQTAIPLTPYAASALLVAGAVGIGMALRSAMGVNSVSLVFLTAVLTAGARFGLWPSLFACLASVLCYNFFFLPPLYTFTIADPENVVALFFFTVAAVIASNLAAAMRAQAVTARMRARTTEDLYQFSRKLAAIVSLDDLLWATAYQVAAMLKVRVVLLLPDRDGNASGTGGVSVRAGYPPEDELDLADLAAAKWCWQSNRPAGRGADTLPGARRLFLPMRTGRGPVAVVGIDSDTPGPLLTPDQRRLLDALTDQAAVSIERITLAEDVDRARLLAETERLRTALLTSISHDLRTPLASILGAASSLRSYHELLEPKSRDELLQTIQDEAERLNRFVGNLLDMTRLESGALSLRLEPADLGELIGSALTRAAKVLAHHVVVTDMAADLPLLNLDVVLFEQVLFNLLDNAAKYAPRGSTVTLRAWRDGAAGVKLQVCDEGPGIPPEALDHVFDKFVRVEATDHQRAGTGLGLAICRGFVEAMGGSIVASNRKDPNRAATGALFTIALPASVTSLASSAPAAQEHAA
jgi:two-component system sensor histidine kinase KdpD